MKSYLAVIGSACKLLSVLAIGEFSIAGTGPGLHGDSSPPGPGPVATLFRVSNAPGPPVAAQPVTAPPPEKGCLGQGRLMVACYLSRGTLRGARR